MKERESAREREERGEEGEEEGGDRDGALLE